MLFDAIIENDILKLKKEIELGANIHVVDSEGWSYLMYASQNGHIEIVKLLLEASSDIRAVDSEGWTPLMYASQNCHIEIVKLLLESGSNIHAVDRNDWTALMHASDCGRTEVVKSLLTSGADANDLFKLDSFEHTMSQPFYPDYIEKHLHLLTTENLKVWKSFRLKNLFV